MSIKKERWFYRIVYLVLFTVASFLMIFVLPEINPGSLSYYFTCVGILLLTLMGANSLHEVISLEDEEAEEKEKTALPAN